MSFTLGSGLRISVDVSGVRTAVVPADLSGLVESDYSGLIIGAVSVPLTNAVQNVLQVEHTYGWNPLGETKQHAGNYVQTGCLYINWEQAINWSNFDVNLDINCPLTVSSTQLGKGIPATGNHDPQTCLYYMQAVASWKSIYPSDTQFDNANANGYLSVPAMVDHLSAQGSGLTGGDFKPQLGATNYGGWSNPKGWIYFALTRVYDSLKTSSLLTSTQINNLKQSCQYAAWTFYNTWYVGNITNGGHTIALNNVSSGSTSTALNTTMVAPSGISAYLSGVAATTITSAGQIATTTGGSSVNKNTTIGLATGYGEIFALGTSNAWAAAGSIGSPSGHGWLLDSTFMEGRNVIAGLWTISLKFQLANAVVNGSITADIHVRTYVRSSGGVYTQIGTDMTNGGRTISTSSTQFTWNSPSEPSVTFNAGDKLYVDCWLNITANNAGQSNALLKCYISNSATAGTTTAEVFLPTTGYVPGSTTLSLASIGSNTPVAGNLTITDAVNGNESIQFFNLGVSGTTVKLVTPTQFQHPNGTSVTVPAQTKYTYSPSQSLLIAAAMYDAVNRWGSVNGDNELATLPFYPTSTLPQDDASWIAAANNIATNVINNGAIDPNYNLFNSIMQNSLGYALDVPVLTVNGSVIQKQAKIETNAEATEGMVRLAALTGQSSYLTQAKATIQGLDTYGLWDAGNGGYWFAFDMNNNVLLSSYKETRSTALMLRAVHLYNKQSNDFPARENSIITVLTQSLPNGFYGNQYSPGYWYRLLGATQVLTVYESTVAATTETTADKVSTATGGTATNKNTTISTSTGYGEVYSQGTSNAWAGAGSIGSPSGHGWLLDATTLEGQQILAGNWTPIVQAQVSVGTVTVDMYIRAYVRSSGGTYTQIGSNMVKTGCAMTSTTTIYTFNSTAQPAQNFNVGDKLYLDFWLNITAAGSSGTVFENFASTSASSGAANDFQITTPGYQAQGTPAFSLFKNNYTTAFSTTLSSAVSAGGTSAVFVTVTNMAKAGAGSYAPLIIDRGTAVEEQLVFTIPTNPPPGPVTVQVTAGFSFLHAHNAGAVIESLPPYSSMSAKNIESGYTSEAIGSVASDLLLTML